MSVFFDLSEKRKITQNIATFRALIGQKLVRPIGQAFLLDWSKINKSKNGISICLSNKEKIRKEAKDMTMIEIETKMGENGIIQIPEAELKAAGLKEGDELCLLYVAIRDDTLLNTTGEFMLEKRNSHK